MRSLFFILGTTTWVGMTMAAQILTVELDEKYSAKFRIGKNTEVNMFALFNFDQTLVTSINCKNCPSKIYTPKPTANLSLTANYTYVSPFRTGDSLDYEGMEVVDTFCVPTLDDYMCTVDRAEVTDDDYSIIVLNKFLNDDAATNPDFEGILGLTPNPKKKDFTLGSYYRRMSLSDSNTLAIKKSTSGGFILNYGKVPSSENVTWVPFNTSNSTGLW